VWVVMGLELETWVRVVVGGCGCVVEGEECIYGCVYACDCVGKGKVSSVGALMWVQSCVRA